MKDRARRYLQPWVQGPDLLDRTTQASRSTHSGQRWAACRKTTHQTTSEES